MTCTLFVTRRLAGSAVTAGTLAVGIARAYIRWRGPRTEFLTTNNPDDRDTMYADVNCDRCGRDMRDEYVMLRLSVWNEAVERLSVGTRDALCLRSIEEGVDRELEPADFADCELNHLVYERAFLPDVIRRMGTPTQWASRETIDTPDAECRR